MRDAFGIFRLLKMEAIRELRGGLTFVLILLSCSAAFFCVHQGYSMPSDINYTVGSMMVPRGFDSTRIVQVTDLHFFKGTSDRRIDDLAKRVIAAKPDLILFTGDLVDGTVGQRSAQLRRFIDDLKKGCSPRFGMISEERWRRFNEKMEAVEQERQRLRSQYIGPGSKFAKSMKEKTGLDVTRDLTLEEVLRRPEMSYARLKEILGEEMPADPKVSEQVEIQVKSVSEAGWPSNPLESDWSEPIVVAFSDFAELQAKSHTPMYMKDWIQKLDDFLKLSGKALLTHAGKISAELAKDKADAEYDKFRERTALQLSPVERDFLENFEGMRKKIKA